MNILNEFSDTQIAYKEQNTKFEKIWFFTIFLQ